MKRNFCFIIVMIFIMSLIACGNNQKRNTSAIPPEEKFKKEIIDKYPDDQVGLLYNGKNSIFITTYNGVDVSAYVHHIDDIPKVIDILCPIVLEVVEKNGYTLKNISIGYNEKDEKGDSIKDKIVNWRSNDGKTGFLFVAATGIGKKDCTSEDVLKHFDSIDWEKLDEIASNKKKVWYIIDEDTKQFHKTDCSNIKNTANANYILESKEQLIKNGYFPCPHCSL